MRRGLALLGVLAGVFAIAGCTPEFAAPPTGKAKGDDAVQVKFKICRSGQSCPSDASTRRGDPPPTTTHHLLAFRVPRGTKVPRRFRSTAKTDIRYERNGRYTRSLRTARPRLGQGKWFGFISESLDPEIPPTARFKIVFGLRSNGGNVFRWRPVTGYAYNAEGEAKVRCEDDPFANNEYGTCITDPGSAKKTRRQFKIDLRR